MQMQRPNVSLAVAAEACTGVREDASLVCVIRPFQGQTVPRQKRWYYTRSIMSNHEQAHFA